MRTMDNGQVLFCCLAETCRAVAYAHTGLSYGHGTVCGMRAATWRSAGSSDLLFCLGEDNVHTAREEVLKCMNPGTAGVDVGVYVDRRLDSTSVCREMSVVDVCGAGNGKLSDICDRADQRFALERL